MVIGLKRGDAGYTLVELAISVALASIVLLSMLSILGDFNFFLRKSTHVATVDMLRNKIMQELNRPRAWVNTYSAATNTSFSCVLSSTPPAGACPIPSPALFNVYDYANKVILDVLTSSTSGFNSTSDNITGMSCSGFPSLKCPIRLETKWEMVSYGGGYFPTNQYPYGFYPSGYFTAVGVTSGTYGYIGNNSAQVRVTGTFSFYTPDKGTLSAAEYKNQTDAIPALNPRKYNFSLIKDVP